jgi:hypothetical protein
MPVHKIESTNTTLTIWFSANRGVAIRRNNFPGNQVEKEAAIKLFAQGVSDTIVPIADLPADDPDKAADPATARIFWDGTNIRYRELLIDFVSWPSGEPCNIKISRVF